MQEEKIKENNIYKLNLKIFGEKLEKLREEKSRLLGQPKDNIKDS